MGGLNCEGLSGTISKTRIGGLSLAGIVFGALAGLSLPLEWSSQARGQGISDVDENLRIEAINVTISNPSPDAARNSRVEDAVRRALGTFPSDRYQRTTTDLALSTARRNPQIVDIAHGVSFGPTGGVVLDVSVTLSNEATVAGPRGVMAGYKSDFPVLFDNNGVYIRARFETLGMYYGNNNAWYGRPDLMLNGNPLVEGKTAGLGYSNWLEGFVHTGLYGIAPLTQSIYAYGGASAVLSGSAGQELFTDNSRMYLGAEDAFAGMVGGVATEEGQRLVYNASVGRQRFSIGDGFLIANTASNGGDRGALQSNPRWAADMQALGQVKYNNSMFEAFYLDPDELPIIDSKTKIVGANFETKLWGQLEVGATFLQVPESDFTYYTTSEVFSRKGLQVYDARLRWQRNPATEAGPFIAAEAGFQRNENFDMAAYAFYGEAGYSFADLPWSPTISYRYAQFSGDDPNTSRFERWDPLLSGGNGEQWVEGINHFKVFQNSNLIAHRFQVRFRPTPQIELVPQLWLFRAQSTTNLGGNPALSFLGSKDLGFEANLTAKYFMSKNMFVQGHVAATFPGEAIDMALGSTAKPWVSTMLFLRIGY